VTGPGELAVRGQGLRKAFGNKIAVAGIDLLVAKGSFFGVVGPNGAGKTTTIKMLTGLLRPDGGQAWVAGVDVWAEPVRARTLFGVLPDDLRLFERLTGRELLTYIGLLRGLDEATVAGRTSELLEVLGLDEAAGRLVADYSQGMRKKIALGAALLHVPTVLFLDEPFESVDPVSARVITDVLEHYCRQGGTVVFSSHVMDTVERLCDGVAIVNLGHVVAQGPIADVCRGRRLEDVFIEAVGAGDLVRDAALGWLDGAGGA
jgi:ABC-2 type transport system ATP-binding protein